MFSSLRNRLLASYLLLLIGTLGGILAALFVATSAQPAPPQTTYQQLDGLILGSDMESLIPQFSINRPIAEDSMREIADKLDVRLLVINLHNDRDGVIQYDSEDEMDFRTSLLVRVESNPQPRSPNGPPVINGSFNHNGVEWLFSGLIRSGFLNEQYTIFMVSIERPTRSLQAVLGEFGEAWVQPVIQAGVIGITIAVIMSALISRTIVHPLRGLVNAAQAIAQGDMEHRASVIGPSEVRAVAEAFNTMSAEVRATQQSQQDFMLNVTHDLKTPLTSIQGFSQAIMDGTARDTSKAATIIHEESERLTRLVFELTDLARMQARQLSMHLEPLDLGEIARTVAGNLRVVAAKKRITVKLYVPPLPLISGDGDRLVQVFNNLIGNAIKYTPDGGSVTLRATHALDGVNVTVSDTGIGIPEKDLSRVFERFYQVDKSRGPMRGTGLGLAITHEIVLAHGGSISVSSTEGAGTTFTLWFPAIAPG